MPKPKLSVEIEIKLPVRSTSALQARLKKFHAREITPRTHELNTLYDTPRQTLRHRGRLIRVRIEHPAAPTATQHPPENATAILTYKGPAPAPIRAADREKKHIPNGSHFKIRDEAEVSVTNQFDLHRILQGLGLRPTFRYEKFRTTYTLPRLPLLKIELDETPIGIYLELEGPTSAIDRAARLLGYTRKDYCTASYGTLYLADCRRRGQKPADMLFSPTNKFKKHSLFP
jgi:adenylate cyclase class 2